MFVLPTFKNTFWYNKEQYNFSFEKAFELQLAAFGTGILLGYPFWRGWTLYTSQVELLRTSLQPTKLRSSDLKYKGGIHATLKLYAVERSFKSLYRGITPLLCMLPITTATAVYIATLAEPNNPMSIRSDPKSLALAAGAIATAELVCQPLRYLHIVMASTRAGERSRPTAMQILSRVKVRDLSTGLGFGLLASLCYAMPTIASITNPDPNALPDDPVQLIWDTTTSVSPFMSASLTLLGVTFHTSSIRRIVDSLRGGKGQELVPRYPKSWNSSLLPWILQLRGSWRTKLIGTFTFVLPVLALEIPSLVLDYASAYMHMLPMWLQMSERLHAYEEREKRKEAERTRV